MKKIIIALVLVAGVGTLVYQSAQNAKLSKAEDNQAGVLLAAGPSGGDTSTADYVGGPSLDDSSTKPAKPGCRNTLACNRDETATTDGGTCEYAFWSVVKNTSADGLFPDKFVFNSDEKDSFYNEDAFIAVNRSTEGASDDSVKILPKQGTCTRNDCVNLSIVRMSGLASVFPGPDSASFTSSVESKGFVSGRVAEFATGMKACDVAKPKKADSPKAKPVNSKVRR